jgi:hypothetical protein
VFGVVRARDVPTAVIVGGRGVDVGALTVGVRVAVAVRVSVGVCVTVGGGEPVPANGVDVISMGNVAVSINLGGRYVGVTAGAGVPLHPATKTIIANTKNLFILPHEHG